MNNRPVKVLVIDDNADNLITLKVLVKEHFSEAIVFTAQSGKKGLQTAIDEDPDVILLDVVMPEMDGFEVCRKIKNDKKLSAIPVIFITALKGDKETRSKAIAVGADAFLSKPIDETELTVQIRAMVRIKDAAVQKLNENQRLAALVEEKTRELKNTNLATMNLLEDLKHEIKARRESEVALRKSEEKYRLMAENMGNVITMLDMELNYTYGTPNVERVLGFTVEEYLKLRVDETIAPESLQLVMKTFEEEMAFEMSGNADPKRTRVLELEEYCKDGSTIWMENVISFVRDEAGNPIGILAVSRDVTERRMVLEEKARLTEQLYHAQKMESVGTLAGGIAHDFNNLLQVIGGYTSMLLTVKGRDASEIEKLKTIEKAVDRASELVNNLLAFSRKNVSMKKEVDINSEIASSVKILERTIPKMVTIRTDLDEAIQKISADHIQIEQIILNLGKNASDAMPDGGEILIKTENIENKGGFECYCGKILQGKFVMMTVSDTGSGMDKETKEHIFDPFFTTKEVGKGTGLGLASVYGIVESHGGHIHCESELGKGTVFYIYFPAVDSGIESRKVITEKTKKLEGSETVLIVDDEKNIRDIYSTALKEFGYKVVTAQSGEEALIIFNENHQGIDLTILDLGMPGMGGFKCMLEMKKCAPDSKIIIASGYSEVFQTEDMIKSGASGFIQKPFKLKSILEKIRETLDKNTQPEHN